MVLHRGLQVRAFRALGIVFAASLTGALVHAQNAPIPTPTQQPTAPSTTQSGATAKEPQASAPKAAATKDGPAATKDGVKFLRYVRAGAQGAKVRNIYDAQGVAIGDVATGGILAVHDERSGWLEVEAPAGFSVWVFGEYVAPAAEPGMVQITGNDVRMRPLPSSGPESLPLRQLLGHGQRVRLLGRNDPAKPLAEDWVNISTPAGTRGWVAASETESLPAGADGAALWAEAVKSQASVAPASATLGGPNAIVGTSEATKAQGNDSQEVTAALRKAEEMLSEARGQVAAGGTADYATVRKAYEDVLAMNPGESTRTLVQDRIAICSAYVDGLALSTELQQKIEAIDAALKRRQAEMAKAARRGPLEGRFDERGWVEKVQVIGEEEPVYLLRWRGEAMAELVCSSGRFDLDDYLDFEIGVSSRDVRGPIAGPTAALTRPKRVDVSRIEVISGRRPNR